MKDSAIPSGFDNNPAVAEASRRVVEHLERAAPNLKRVRPALEVVPGMTPHMVLHSGPAIAWDNMCVMLREAIKAGAVIEGLAVDAGQAQSLIERGSIVLNSCHEMGGVAPVAGVVTASMPVFLVEEACTRTKAFAPLNEGLGQVLRYGAFGPEVTSRLIWMRDVLAPVLNEALIASQLAECLRLK